MKETNKKKCSWNQLGINQEQISKSLNKIIKQADIVNDILNTIKKRQIKQMKKLNIKELNTGGLSK